MKSICHSWCIFTAFALFLAPGLPAQELPKRTALDDYIAKPDPSYRWKIVKRERSDDGVTTVVVDMVSQTWRSPRDVDRPEWQHWLLIAIPDGAKYDTGLLFISGGSNGREPPSKLDDRIGGIARATKSVVAELKMIPNQPLVFHGDGVRRTEDDLIAYTWDQYLKTADPTWPARGPMVKAAVRAMDTVTAAVERIKRSPPVRRFVVAGASKRGWTTWMTGAVDERVVAIVPIVIDVVNVQANTQNHFAAYGFWAPSVGDYVEHGITMRFHDPRMLDLLKIVDPWFYRHRLRMPKLLLNAAGDQFFPPDSSQFYFADLEGPKCLRYVPNADHSLDNSDAVDTLVAWYALVLQQRPFPKFTWRVDDRGAIIVTPQDQPRSVKLWQATNPYARDFRLETLGAKYKATELKPNDAGEYVGQVTAPQRGWTAYFVELTYDVGLPVPLKLTTDVHITPNTLPFAGRDSTRPPTISIDCRIKNSAAAKDVVKEIANAASENAFQAVASDLYASAFAREGDTKSMHVFVNWKPVGRFEVSAKAIAAWLSEHGCDDIQFRLESGPNHAAASD